MKTKNNILRLITVAAIVLFAGCSTPTEEDKTIGEMVEEPNETVEEQSSDNPFDKYKLKVSDGETEIEKTAIIKFNNHVMATNVAYEKRRGKTEIHGYAGAMISDYSTDFRRFMWNNMTNISLELFCEIIDRDEKMEIEMNSMTE